jgi:hypothetical protein
MVKRELQVLDAVAANLSYRWKMVKRELQSQDAVTLVFQGDNLKAAPFLFLGILDRNGKGGEICNICRKEIRKLELSKEKTEKV